MAESTRQRRGAAARLHSEAAHLDGRDVDERRRDAEADRIVVESEGIGVTDRLYDIGVERARERFGGVDIAASLVGMLTALAFLILLGGLVGAAVGAIGYQTGLAGNEEELSIGALAGGLGALFLAYLLGGWTSGRIARYDGARNGLMVGIWTILLGGVLAGLGAWFGDEYNVFERVDLPSFISRDAVTAGAVISGLVAAATMLGAGALGGRWGDRFHRRADATIASARPGGIHDAQRSRAVSR